MCAVGMAVLLSEQNEMLQPTQQPRQPGILLSSSQDLEMERARLEEPSRMACWRGTGSKHISLCI